MIREMLFCHLEELLKSNNRFVSLMHANNGGNLLDIKAVGEMCQTYDAIFHSDTVQTWLIIPLIYKNCLYIS